MAALRVKVEEGELLLQNYEVVPPVLRTYFGKVSEAKGNAEKYDSAFYCALSAVHDVHEELVSVLWEHREKNIQKYVTNSPRVRFADLSRSHVKSTQTDELVKSILKTNELTISEDFPIPTSDESSVPSEIPRGVSDLEEQEDEDHFGGTLIPETPSTVPQEMCVGRVEDQFHLGGEYEFLFGDEPPSVTSSVPSQVLEPSVRAKVPTNELVKVQPQQVEAEAVGGYQEAAKADPPTPCEKVRIYVAEDGGSGALNVISESVEGQGRFMKPPSNASQHRLPEASMCWIYRPDRGLVEVLGDRSFRSSWIKFQADYTVLHFGQWDILRNQVGAVKPIHFVEDVILHINLFKDQAKEFIDPARWRSYEERMKSHIFVLVAPKRDEMAQNFMTSNKFNNIRAEVVKAMRLNTKRLYEEARVVTCTAGSSYQLKIHAYLARLICSECRPTERELLSKIDIRWGGCDTEINGKWGKI